MRLSKDLALAVQVARFATEHDLDPANVAELIALARRAFSAGERAAPTPGHEEAERKTGEAFEEKAVTLGFGVSWPGLWPTLTRAGREIHLPS